VGEAESRAVPEEIVREQWSGCEYTCTQVVDRAVAFTPAVYSIILA
jgi:hypothetical protein